MSTPYYEDAWTTIYHGKAEDILPTLSTPVDLLLTDPPYGQSYQSNRGGTHRLIEGDDGTVDLAEVLRMACRLLARGRHAYIFGPCDLSDTPLTAAVQLIWDKELVGMGDLSLPWSESHEPITFAVFEPSKANRAKGYGNLSARIRQQAVIRCQRTQGGATKRHPTEKPVRLLRQLIESSSCFDETVLDPYMGVGSTLVAARMEERKSIGIEMDERYCEIAAKRMGQEVGLRSRSIVEPLELPLFSVRDLVDPGVPHE
jgi:site-specific DNA-methyltransferase (adenine-specific)